MPQEVTQLLLALVPGVIIAVVTAFLTVRLSLRQFYSQRWWERKAEAYSTIVESIYHAKNYVARLLEAEEEGSEVSNERRKQLEEYSMKAYEELNKAASIGAFIISDEAATHISKLLKDLRSEEHDTERSWYDYLDSKVSILDRSLVKIREYAKKDLEIR